MSMVPMFLRISWMSIFVFISFTISLTSSFSLGSERLTNARSFHEAEISNSIFTPFHHRTNPYSCIPQTLSLQKCKRHKKNCKQKTLLMSFFNKDNEKDNKNAINKGIQNPKTKKSKAKTITAKEILSR